MKHILHDHKAIKYISIVLLILVFTFTTMGATVQTHTVQMSVSQIAVSNYQRAQKNSNLSDEEKIKAAINAYFTLRYEGPKLLEAQDFSVLIEDDTLAWVKMEKDKRDIEIYVATLYNAPYVSYSFTIDYDSIIIDKDTASVQLRESNEVVTKLDLTTSKMGNLPHSFTLHNKNREWVVYRDEYADEFSHGLMYQTKEEILQQVDAIYQKSMQENSVSENEGFASNIGQPLDSQLTLTTYAYSGTKAKNYANQYWNTTNPPYYLGLSGDCANFVSQAIYAGEGKTPPDTSGMTTSPTRSDIYDWYYVWNSSGSAPWIGVPQQITFIAGNTSRIGPYGSGTPSYCDARIGDVVQIKDASGLWFHEGIIVSKSTPCYGSQSLYIDAHTTNRYNYNLYNWSSRYPTRFILINGWRGN